MSMLALVVFVVLHESAEESPFEIEAGFAESVQVGAEGGGGGVVTVMVAEQCTEPPGPVAVPV